MAQRDREREEGDEVAVPPPYRRTGQGTSSARNWEDGSIAVQNQGGRGGRKNGWSDKIKSVSKKVFNALASVNSQHSAKKVDAGDHVLETYHDSFLYGRVPLPVKVRSSLRAGYIGHGWHILEFFFALVSGVLYVYSTYQPDSEHNWVARTQNIISVVFVVDYLLRIYR